MGDQIKTAEDIIAQTPAHIIQKGPMEGMILVDGCPQMERCDMPTISFESILALQRANEGK